MAVVQRIDSTGENGESSPWVPVSDFVIQGAAQSGSRARIEIHARLHANAPWVKVETIRPEKSAFMACRKLPEVKLIWSGNKAGDPLKAWSAE